MTAANIEAHTKNQFARIVLSGEIDSTNAVKVEENILAAISTELTAVSLDLTDLLYIDSAGLHVLFRVAERLEDMQISLQLLAPPGSPARLVIEHSGLESLTRF